MHHAKFNVEFFIACYFSYQGLNKNEVLSRNGSLFHYFQLVSVCQKLQERFVDNIFESHLQLGLSLSKD